MRPQSNGGQMLVHNSLTISVMTNKFERTSVGFADSHRVVGMCSCCAYVLSHAWLFVTLWTVAHQADLSMGFFRQDYWSELPFPIPGDLPDPGIEPESPVSLVSISCIGRWILYNWAIWEAPSRTCCPYFLVEGQVFFFKVSINNFKKKCKNGGTGDWSDKKW